ncbi:hypothetical protein BGZ97_005087, partial [Linnemannia gamsii]
MTFTATLIAITTVALSMVSAQTEPYRNLTNPFTTPTQYGTFSVTLSPSTPCINQAFCLNLTGCLSTPIIQGAKYSITGRWLGRLVYTDNSDLCEILAAVGTPCPIPAGTTNLTICRPLKPNTPPNMPIYWQFVATNGDGGLITAQA